MFELFSICDIICEMNMLEMKPIKFNILYNKLRYDSYIVGMQSNCTFRNVAQFSDLINYFTKIHLHHCFFLCNVYFRNI